MGRTVTVQKSVYLWCFLSITVFHSVSAGGAYCAKTARARAAALGLEYPGVHGAPDLSAPVHHHPTTFSYAPFADPNMDFRVYDQPRESPLDIMYKQVDPRSFLQGHGTSVPRSYNSFPRELLDRAPESSFEEVKHVAPSLFGAMTLNPRSHMNSPPFVYTKHDLVVDESAPNRHGVPSSGLAPPQSRDHPADESSPARNTQGRRVPLFHSSRLSSKGGAKLGAPRYGRWKMIQFPRQPHLQLPNVLNSKPFFTGKTILNSVRKTRPDFKIM
ncbi:uncharacterized protein LOC106524679 [Austrofundulus limnaeus]|uniref:Uncharacterized protein LOC106524679 n=1 Tax=Austrofundulus limnaeus TaxID=52670 RepID=A0A2I4C240_AUSLI|nr:PREDICTED: uncharacterized protein LOC106524679 [Austrofundulus limnaeus]